MVKSYYSCEWMLSSVIFNGHKIALMCSWQFQSLAFSKCLVIGNKMNLVALWFGVRADMCWHHDLLFSWLETVWFSVLNPSAVTSYWKAVCWDATQGSIKDQRYSHSFYQYFKHAPSGHEDFLPFSNLYHMQSQWQRFVGVFVTGCDTNYLVATCLILRLSL